MRKWLWLVMLAVCLPSAGAADLTLGDFAYGIEMPVSEGTAVAALSLPEAVYGSACRPDLGDIRVFNADNEPVPHMIRYARTRKAQGPWRPLKFFPLPEEAKPEAGGYRVFVRTGPNGAEVRADSQPAQAPLETARTFLVDLGCGGRSPDQLRLKWQPEETGLLAILAVDASDDLVRWTTIVQRSAISDIRYGGRRLLSNTIFLERSSRRYLRLRRLDSGPAIVLDRIDGRDRPEDRAPVRVFAKIDGTPVPEAPGVFEYRTGGGFPVDRVNLIFDQANSMADAVVESRTDPSETWTRRYGGLFYRIDVDATPMTSAPQAVAISMDRHWRLTVDASDSTIGRAVPRLEIGYRPHDLFFIARGKGPFTLAFGSALAKPLKVNVSALFDGIGRQNDNGLERWVMEVGKPVVLGGPGRLSPLPKPLPMRRITLWSILVAGVMVVAFMSWCLARRMRT